MAKKKKNKNHKKPGTAGGVKPKSGTGPAENAVEEEAKVEAAENAVEEEAGVEATENAVEEEAEVEAAENAVEEEAEIEPCESAGEGEPEDEGENITLKSETADEIENADRSMVFLKVAKAYEDVKKKRENYKKYGPLAVLITGVVFLTLMFSMENKATFLIIWVITVLFTAALMIRAEYNYHKFRYYLGLADEDAEEDEEGEEEQNEIEQKDGQEENGQ